MCPSEILMGRHFAIWGRLKCPYLYGQLVTVTRILITAGIDIMINSQLPGHQVQKDAIGSVCYLTVWPIAVSHCLMITAMGIRHLESSVYNFLLGPSIQSIVHKSKIIIVNRILWTWVGCACVCVFVCLLAGGLRQVNWAMYFTLFMVLFHILLLP